jgi:hypothetical protein
MIERSDQKVYESDVGFKSPDMNETITKSKNKIKIKTRGKHTLEIRR